MRRYLSFFMTILLAVMLMGMGDIGGKPGGSIPKPDKDFSAVITDINSVKTTCTFVSVNGKDYLKGTQGSFTATIPFEKISTINVRASGDEKEVAAMLKLVDGKEITMYINGNADIYGKAGYGNIQIKMRNVSEINFNSSVK